MVNTVEIRKIEPTDNQAVGALITKVMTEYDCVGEGYSINDPEVSNMYQSYNQTGATFFVVEKESEIIGCAGIAQLADGDEDTCELRKMYFYPEARGLGLGQKMLDICLDAAKKIGYKKCYLETVERMHRAKKLYLKNGFEPLCSNMGQTGHSACDSYYLKEL